ncbi:CopD family protein [Scleromatobacter humisilvae]|uniref:CopD family protein n=1 Tax=Scleromatobacter humisilvae TaxID=2897159 RepID=A0A9X1YPB4_9BURK|nr:CopD family protein [Scleromatobacter humisilvae]MCK9688132.1 CopD family protein [Scleromatobacter humisilvae]
MDDATLAALRTAASALFDIGFAAMAGALATPALLRDASSAWATRCSWRCRTLFAAGGTVALAASLAWMWVEAISMAESPPLAALMDIGGIVAGTGFGRAWAVATVGLAASLALTSACRLRAMPLRTLALVLVVVAVAHASAGHAGANGIGWLVPATTVHLLATGLWAGSVFAAALVVLRGRPDAIDVVRHARGLSSTATAALAGVAATGVAIAWHGLDGSAAALAPASGSSWGFALDVKLALVAIAAALGAFNRFAVMPALPASWPRFAHVLRVEAGVLLAALVAAAVLANGEPPVV